MTYPEINDDYIHSCPARESNGVLWELNADDHARSRAMLEPLAETLANHLNADAANPALAEYVQSRSDLPFSGIIGHLPYGREYAFTSVFMLDKTSPRLPRNRDEVAQAEDRYWSRMAPIVDAQSRGLARLIPTRHHVHEMAMEGLYAHEDGIVLDAAKVALQRRTTEEHVQSGRYFIDSYQDRRGDLVRSTLMATSVTRGILLGKGLGSGRFETFYGGTTDAVLYDKNTAFFDTSGPGGLAAPVGAYGPDIARYLLRSAVYGINIAKWVLSRQAERVAAGNESLIQARFLRGRNGDRKTPGGALVATVQEGIRSDMEVKSMLLAEEVPGYDNPYDLLIDIAQNKLVEKLTRALPLNVMGPAALGGMYFPGLLQGSGPDLHLNSLKVEALKGYRDIQRREMLRSHLYAARTHPGQPHKKPIVGFGLPCPAAMPGGALQKITDAQTRVTLALEGT